ncbi:MAG: hypothetical protein E6767_06340 [Dysgonomonas sp.]|nr:hypothetical protein [Dysgonomonas sp.]
MKTIIFILLSFLNTSICYSRIHIQSDNYCLTNDTIINYDIEGISAEGAEAQVLYSSGKIKSAQIAVYGESGQANINYLFYTTYIEVEEVVYSFKNDIEKIESNDDMFLEYKLKYFIDYQGKRIKINKTILYIDIFDEFKSVVPFTI